MRLPRRRRNLADRLRPYVRQLPPPERMVSADPIRMFLYRWMIETGDSVKVIARGFGLEAAEINELLSSGRRHLTEKEDALLRSRLHMEKSGDFGRSRVDLC